MHQINKLDIITGITISFLMDESPSIKNFILLDKNNNRVFEFGKISNNKYSINFKHPLSLYQAFGLAISSMY